jgi:probable F420-dependent oxidoreductase
MKFGLAMFPTDYAIRPDELAIAVEERGFESIWFPEHTHIPASRRTPFPGGGDLPKEYRHTYDLFVALAMAAAVTRKLKLGTGICLLVERDPIITAKEVASLDRLSGGRVLFGIGGGWNVEEMENHGTSFKSRWKLLRERVEAMKAIWTQDEASYHGELVRFDPIWSWPKPVQKPHPPIYLGGHGWRARRRVIRYCDGWMPIPLRAGDLEKQINLLRGEAKEAGRDPSTLTISAYFAPADPDGLRSWAKLGVDRAILSVPPAGRDDVLPLLDRYAEIIRLFAS